MGRRNALHVEPESRVLTSSNMQCHIGVLCFKNGDEEHLSCAGVPTFLILKKIGGRQIDLLFGNGFPKTSGCIFTKLLSARILRSYTLTEYQVFRASPWCYFRVLSKSWKTTSYLNLLLPWVLSTPHATRKQSKGSFRLQWLPKLRDTCYHLPQQNLSCSCVAFRKATTIRRTSQ